MMMMAKVNAVIKRLVGPGKYWLSVSYLEGTLATISHRCCSGTNVQFCASVTIASTSSRP